MIRDAQILEKEEIKKDMDDEEKRLDVIMEVLYMWNGRHYLNLNSGSSPKRHQRRGENWIIEGGEANGRSQTNHGPNQE